MKSLFRITELAILFLSIAFGSGAQDTLLVAEPTSLFSILEINSPAPPLHIQKWVKGKPVNTFEKGKIYVVEFTGTGCPPCRKAMPHLTRLSRKYGGDKITIISVFDGLEDPAFPGYMDVFNALYKENGKNMDYTIALDKPGQPTIKAWKIHAVPYVHIVNEEGKIAWSGSADALDLIMENAAAGNLQKGIDAANNEAEELSLAPMFEFTKADRYDLALKMTDSLIEVLRPKNHHLIKHLYYMKYEFLANIDEQKAHDWVRWMLQPENKNKLKEYDWDHFISDVMSRTKKPDYDIIFGVIDRCIELAEYRFIVGVMNKIKSNVYLMRSRENPGKPEAAADTASAIQMCRNAIVEVMKSGKDLKMIAELHYEIGTLSADRGEAKKSFKQALFYYDKALKQYKASSDKSDTTKRYIADMEEKVEELNGHISSK